MRQLIRSQWILCVLLLSVWACSDTATDVPDTVADLSAPDQTEPADVQPDILPSDEGALDGGDVTALDSPPPVDTVEPPPPQWSLLPMGASGDILRVRFLGAQGFRMTGEGGTILRPLADGWVRQWTLRVDTPLRDIHHGSDGFHAVGDNGTWWTLSEQGHWTALDPGVVVDLRGLTSMGADTVGVGDQGIILRRTNGVFGQELTGVSTNLNSIDATSAVEAIAVGNGGQILKRVIQATDCPSDGDELCAPCTSSDDCASGVCVQFFGEEQSLCSQACDLQSSSCPDGMYCVEGDEGQTHCAPELGYAWLSFTVADSSVVLHDVLALDSQNVWAVGAQAKIMHYDGQWSGELTNLSNDEDLRAVAQGAGYVISVGSNGAVVGRNPSGDWNINTDVVGPLNKELLFHGAAIGGGQIVIAGEQGGMLIKELPDGDFHDAHALPRSTILDMHCTDTQCLMVGEDGLWIEFSADGYGAIDTGTNAQLNGCVIAEDGSYWAVGDGGIILSKKQGASIESIQSPTSLDLNAIAQDTTGDIVAVGAVGTIIRRSEPGGDLETEQSPSLWDLHDIFSAEDALIAVGDQGTILRHHEGAWDVIAVNTQSNLFAGEANANRVVVVGANGVVVFGDDALTLTATSMEPAGQYQAVRLLPDGAALVAGWNGQLRLLDDDGLWSALEAPSSEPIYAMSTLDEELILGGVNAQIWTHEDIPFLREGVTSFDEADTP